MIRQDLEKLKLPTTSGVYFFKSGNGEILYIGKATSLRDRVGSYFASDVIKTRGAHIVDMVFKAETVKYQETMNVLEALILEANLIKKYKPYYNTKEKDDKSFNCVIITKEDYPRVLLVRQKDIDVKSKTVDSPRIGLKKQRYQSFFGPYTSPTAIKDALKIIRKIFPFRDTASAQKDKAVFYRQIGLAPDISSLQASKEYRKNVGRIKLILQGRFQSLLKELKREMNRLAKTEKFEEADILKKKIFSLEHVQDISLIKRDKIHYDILQNDIMRSSRIEAYDVAHISGKHMVGVMVVVEGETSQKSEYRKFNIKGFQKANDAGALREMLVRRLAHPEWPYPKVIVVDGNIIQKNVAEVILKESGLKASVIAVTKDERHRPKSISGPKEIIETHKYSILLANSEAHRFALSFHKAQRKKAML